MENVLLNDIEVFFSSFAVRPVGNRVNVNFSNNRKINLIGRRLYSHFEEKARLYAKIIQLELEQFILCTYNYSETIEL